MSTEKAARLLFRNSMQDRRRSGGLAVEVPGMENGDIL